MELTGAKKFFFMCHCPIFYCKAQLNTAFQRNLFFHFFVSVLPLSTSLGGTILVLSLLLSPKSALFRWMQKSDGLAVFRAFQNAEPSSAHQLIYGSKIILSKAKTGLQYPGMTEFQLCVEKNTLSKWPGPLLPGTSSLVRRDQDFKLETWGHFIDLSYMTEK